MSGPKRNPDKLNTIGIVVVGICGAVLVYVSIVSLQAFYVSDTSEIQTMADYGGNDTRAHSLRTEQVRSITEVGKNAAAPAKPNEAPKPDTFHISIDDAMKLVVDSAKVDPSMLVPTQGRADKATIKPIFGRPQPLPPAPTPTPAPTDGAGSGSGAGSGAPAPTGSLPSAPTSPTGGQGGGGGTATGGTAGSAATAAPAVNLPREAGTGSAAKAPEKAPAPAKGNAP
jgi:hypothetical protein